MAELYPTLSLLPDPSSTINRTIKLDMTQMGEGYSTRYADGQNNVPGTYTIIYKYLGAADEALLRGFINRNTKGQSVQVPLWPEDPTGHSTGYYVITSFAVPRSDNGVDCDVTITLEEVFVP